MKNKMTLLYLCLSVLGLAACTSNGVRESLGLDKDAPDEFAVMKRAPLEMPDGLALPPPMPGAPRPQEKSPQDQAKQAVFGEQIPYAMVKNSAAERYLLNQAGANNVSADIRHVVDTETQEIAERNKPVAKKLLGLAGGDDVAAADVVDAKAEAARIKKNMEEGKPITEGETPSIHE